MSVIVNMACGLANRMFQYSYYVFLKKKGVDVKIDAYENGTLAHEEVAWERIFPKAKYTPANPLSVLLLGGGNNLFSRFRRKILPFTTKVLEQSTAFDYIIPKAKHTEYVIGVFQNAEMVEFIKDELLNVYEFPPFEDCRNQELVERMRSCESVAIHVRKGKDYQQRIWYQNTCPLDYYKRAVSLMRDKLQNPVFFVFTDNKDWVRENFTEFDYQLIDHNPGSGWGSHCDMQLMSLCKHNIISNSTYSWWGAFLNRHQQKITIVPQIWFNPDSCDEYRSDRLTCKNWIAL